MFITESSFNVLYTTNIHKTHNFYKGLGLVISELSDEKLVVTFGSFELHFVLSTAEPYTKYKYLTEDYNYGQGVIFYIETTDINTIGSLIETLGGNIKAPVFRNHWEYDEMLFEDNNGYKFALYQKPESV